MTWGEGTTSVIAELWDPGIVVPTHSPYNFPVWPVHKPNEKCWLTIYYLCLNANTGPLTAVMPNMAELITIIQEQAHQILATIDVGTIDVFYGPLAGSR